MMMEIFMLCDMKFVIDDGVVIFSYEWLVVCNVLLMDMCQDYCEVLDCIEVDWLICVLVIIGSGGSFCVGGDLKLLKQCLVDLVEQVFDLMCCCIVGGYVWLFKCL